MAAKSKIPERVMNKAASNGKGAMPEAKVSVKQVTFAPHEDPTKAETKNCFRFQEVTTGGQPPIIGALYIQKWALDGKMPEHLTVMIEVS